MMTVLTKKEITELELNMLLAFKKLCEEKDLYFTLCGGTLLGAIRHKGFIPWDDDIDVMMTRPDFTRLCDLIKKGEADLPEHMEFISWFTKPGMDIPFLKIVDTRTRVEEKYMVNDKHLWIDILVIDGCPEDDKILEKRFKRSKLLRKLLFIKQTKLGTGTTICKRIMKSAFHIALFPVSARHLCRSLDKLSCMESFDLSTRIGCIQWGYGPQERVDKKGWLNPIEVEFEGHIFPSPSNYDEYLSNLYGNYMELPPVEKRQAHEMTVFMQRNDKGDQL